MKIGFKAWALAGASICALGTMALASPSFAADADSAAGLDAVIVTAERREANAQKTPISISVVTAKAMEEQRSR